MRDGIVTFLDMLMLVYVLYRALATFVFLPLAGGFFFGHTGIYFVSLILIAAGAVVCCFFEKRTASCVLAGLVGLAAVSFWCFGVLRNQAYLNWSYFGWSVVPELLFAAAGVAGWMIRRADSTEPVAEEASNWDPDRGALD